MKNYIITHKRKHAKNKKLWSVQVMCVLSVRLLWQGFLEKVNMINILYKIISEIIKIFGRLYLYIYVLVTYITIIKKNKQ